ncbi:hypothetical protein Ae201684_006054 [Aphanomyces euteiches]|uniref:Uncharacterized protein n=1 Tax=Aphanomyces euteiches TaxID=100861 RepID=A0A6G0XCX7_9STRA|nr:hypothetical protein Ae201684_006054 [Aphanomyces euteiches]
MRIASSRGTARGSSGLAEGRGSFSVRWELNLAKEVANRGTDLFVHVRAIPTRKSSSLDAILVSCLPSGTVRVRTEDQCAVQCIRCSHWKSHADKRAALLLSSTWKMMVRPPADFAMRRCQTLQDSQESQPELELSFHHDGPSESTAPSGFNYYEELLVNGSILPGRAEIKHYRRHPLTLRSQPPSKAVDIMLKNTILALCVERTSWCKSRRRRTSLFHGISPFNLVLHLAPSCCVSFSKELVSALTCRDYSIQTNASSKRMLDQAVAPKLEKIETMRDTFLSTQ